ncbi:MAG: enoyl-CoA hydratase/isomerase family protein [Burkholderiaceae bacterium]
MPDEALVLSRRDGRTATLILNRPAKKNAMSDEMLREFNVLLEQAIGDDEIRSIVVTGAGDCFTSGRDRRDVGSKGSPPVALEDLSLDRSVELFTNTLRRLLTSPKPTIAAVRGFAFGGGQAMSLACDFLIAERDARFANVEIVYGFPAALNSVLLMRHLGRRRALEIAMIGDVHSAESWHSMGLVNRLAEAGQLDSEVHAFTGVLNERESWAVQRTKALMLAAEDSSLADGMTLGGQLNQILRMNAERSRAYQDGGQAYSQIVKALGP